MHFSKKWLALIGIPAILCTSAMAFTGCKGHGHGKGFITPERIMKIVDWKVDDFMDEINATSTQRERILEIKDRLISEAVVVHTEMAGNHVTLFNEWKSDSPNMDTINGIIDDASARKAAFGKTVADSIVELHSILTPEQRAKITEHIEKNHPKLGDLALN